MSSIRNPVGPQSSKVYWRRRLLAMIVLVVLLIVVISVFAQLRGSKGDAKGGVAGASANPSPAASVPAPAPTVAPVAGAPCVPNAVKLDPVTDKVSYAAGENPKLSFTITNLGTLSCTLNVGTTQQVFTITSGSDVYWSSKDCQTGAVDAPLLIQPNVPQTSTPIAWARERSSVSTCKDSRAAVPAKGATYNLNVTLGTVKSTGSKSFLLN
ncbi:MAG: hypothetical protein H7248_09570 [Microbacteriaceae bacterium]|nr:hypothetical protein [Microbacteriaceae bacterium]